MEGNQLSFDYRQDKEMGVEGSNETGGQRGEEKERSTGS